MTDEAEILEEFLVEAREIIDKLDLDFVQLEKSPADGNLLGVFRYRGLIMRTSVPTWRWVCSRIWRRLI